jgi:biopolymer transport protein ExbB
MMKRLLVTGAAVLAVVIMAVDPVRGQAQPAAKPATGAGLAPAKDAAAAPLDDFLPSVARDEMGSKEEIEEMLRGDTGEKAGDLKKFEVKTDSDIAALEVGDLYKNEETAYKIVAIKTKTAKGGRFTAQRIAGQNEPMRRWIRISGAGPQNIITRTTLLDFYLQGGFFMHPIFILFIAMVVLVVNDCLVYRRKVQCPAEFVSAAESALLQGDLRRFGELSKGAKGLMPFVCRQMLADSGASTADVRSRVEASTANYVNRMRIPVRALNLISVASPLLGLMGTIQGMIVVFEGIAGTSNAGRAAVLAAGIRTALFTTVAGLTTAIPALFAYFVLNQKHLSLVGDCETIFERFMHLLTQVKPSKGQGGNVPEEEAERKAPRAG